MPPGTYPAYPTSPTRGTNGFAIASLVCSLVACGVGSVLAIVFGHIARSQIRRNHEGGNGLAIAGLVLGYLGVAAIAVMILIFAFVVPRDLGTHVARDNARAFERRAVDYARFTRISPRDARAVARALDGTCCTDDVTIGASGVPARGATDSELQQGGWQLQFTASAFDTGYACLTLPDVAAARDADVREGRCRVANPVGGSGV